MLRTILLITLLGLPSPQTAPGIIQGTVTRAGTGEGIADVQITLGVTATPQFVEAFTRLAGAEGGTPAQILAVLTQIMAGPPEFLQTVASAPDLPAEIAPLVNQMVAMRNASNSTGMRATTDANGHFMLKDIRPGSYMLGVQRDGYFAATGNTAPFVGSNVRSRIIVSVPVTVDAESLVTEVNVPLVRGGLISGKVRDSNGQPAVGIFVSTLQLGYRDGQAGWYEINSKITDDRGDYRLFWLPPGEYAVAATPPRPGLASGPKDSYVRTFFPGTIDPQTAQRIVVKDGDELTSMNIDFHVQSTAKVSGQMITTIPSSTGQPANATSTMYLVPRDSRQIMEPSAPVVSNVATDRTNGHFEIRSVLPGSYDLITLVPDSHGREFPGRTRIDVGSSGDLQNVAININPGTDVKARITVAGGALAADAPSLKLQLRAKENYAFPFDAALAQAPGTDFTNGQAQPVPARNPMVTSPSSFTFSNVPDALYTFKVTGLPPTAYIADVRMGENSIFDRGLRVESAPPAPVEVIVNLSGISVEGTVRNGAQKTLPGATVVLAPPQSRRENLALFKVSTTDEAGHFTIRGIPPGEYKVFAWEVNPPDGAPLNGAFMARFEDRGQSISLSSGSTINLNIRAIP